MSNTRPICPACNQKPCAVNKHNHKTGKIYWRSRCDSCISSGRRSKNKIAAWILSGYRKKTVCERCGFKLKYPDKQSAVFHIDGDLKNCHHDNLRTVCLNCRVELQYSKLHWIENTS